MDAQLIDFARDLAAAARARTLPRWRNSCPAEDKGGGAFDPVTDADREAELAMREMIRSRFPQHGISGEEFGDEAGAGRWRWSLDPIDGTRSFICGLPTWTTLIALLEEDSPALGIIDAPVLDETYVGFPGEAFMVVRGEHQPLRTSGCTRLSEARFSTTDPFLCGPPADALRRLLGAVKVARYGHDGYGYARLAGGGLDLVIESGLKPHDYHALMPVIRAAGGHVGDWRGGDDFTGGRLIAAATRELYEAAAELLAE